MAAKSLKDTVLDLLDAVNWQDLATSLYRDEGLEKIAQGFYDYVSNADNRAVVVPATGISTPPPPAVPYPYVAGVDIDVVFNSATVLKQQFLLNIVESSVPTAALTGFFTALTLWLSAPLPVVAVTGWKSPLTPPAVAADTAAGVGTAAFPLMAAQGSLCQAAMAVAAPTSRDGAWDVIEQYVLMGLVGTVTVPVEIGRAHV